VLVTQPQEMAVQVVVEVQLHQAEQEHQVKDLMAAQVLRQAVAAVVVQVLLVMPQ
jgi:hypothetical protein